MKKLQTKIDLEKYIEASMENGISRKQAIKVFNLKNKFNKDK